MHFAAGENVHAPLVRNGLRPFRPADSFYEIYAEDLEPELTRLRPDLVVHGWGVPEAAVAARRAGMPALWHGFGRMFPDGIGFEPGPFERPPRPLIYLTLGTAFGTAEVLTTAIRGLARLDAHVVVAAGRVRPEDLGELPADVTVRAWVPQADVVAHADLVVHHGGSGTTLGALAEGVPQLVLPQGADQFANAEALVTVGAALRLLPGRTERGRRHRTGAEAAVPP